MGNPAAPPEWEETKTAARSLGLQAELLDVRSQGDLDRAFELAIRQHVDALLIGADGLTQMHQQRIVDLVARNRLPAVYPAREFVEAGGLIAYAVNYPDLYFRFASFVDKIFKGAKPGELPVEQPTKFELVINLKTAKAPRAHDPAIASAARGRGDPVMTRCELIAGVRATRRGRRLTLGCFRSVDLGYDMEIDAQPWSTGHAGSCLLAPGRQRGAPVTCSARSVASDKRPPIHHRFPASRSLGRHVFAFARETRALKLRRTPGDARHRCLARVLSQRCGRC